MKRKIRRLENKLKDIVGSRAVQFYGQNLTIKEAKVIIDYCKEFGADKEHVQFVLETSGRPFSINDYTFKKKCPGCKTLMNYCSGNHI